jgi:hypothetical protein
VFNSSVTLLSCATRIECEEILILHTEFSELHFMYVYMTFWKLARLQSSGEWSLRKQVLHYTSTL